MIFANTYRKNQAHNQGYRFGFVFALSSAACRSVVKFFGALSYV